MIKKPRTRGGYCPARGLQNTNPQRVVAPVKKKSRGNYQTQRKEGKRRQRYIEDSLLGERKKLSSQIRLKLRKSLVNYAAMLFKSTACED